MKKFFLFAAALVALSLTSCGGNSTSVPDGNSQATSIDPNEPNQAPPQMEEVSTLEQSGVASTENATEVESQPAEQSTPANQ